MDLTEKTQALETKMQTTFGPLVIDKCRLPASRLQSRGIPSFVGEWVLEKVVPGTGPLTPGEADKVNEWAVGHVPGPSEQNRIRMCLHQGDTVKVLTPVQVEVILKRNRQDRVAKLPLLGIDDAYIAPDIVRQFPDLLLQGMWGVVELTSGDDGVVIQSFKPMQASVNLELFREARRAFTRDEWRALMVSSMGYAPEAYTEDQQILLLCRLVPLVQKSIHLMELAPKGTGKSYVYENISPRVRVVSGGNVSPSVLFVNNASGQWGLLARYAAVVLDEVQSLKFEKPEEIVGALKGFLANGRLTRGGLHEAASDCGLVMLANITLDDQQRPVRDPVVAELPDFLRETAFLDRICGLIPGWELPKLGTGSFCKGTGLKSDYFGDALMALRNDLRLDQICQRRVHLEGNGGIRNARAVQGIASGLLKILYPNGEVTDDEFHRHCLRPALRLRQLIWDQLYTLDGEYRQFDQTIKAHLV